jgi:hypothetical protein
MLRSAISAFTRVFDALWLAAWCTADPGSIAAMSVPALRRTAKKRCTASGTRAHFDAWRSICANDRISSALMTGLGADLPKGIKRG